MKTTVEYQHNDLLGQPITVGQMAAITYASCRRVFVGQVVKLTKQRVRVSFTNVYEYKGRVYSGQTKHIARPGDIVMLGDQLPQHLMMAKLQNKI